MDYNIAFIMPGHILAQTTLEALKELDYEYPVCCGSNTQALAYAEELQQKGTRIIISSGSTYTDLKQESNCLVMEMQYSASACANALKQALSYSGTPAVIGSPELCYWMGQAMETMDIRIPLFEVRKEESFEQITLDLISAGYDIIISGYPSVRIAQEKGCTAIGINTDKSIVKLTLEYARYILTLMEDTEHKYETLQSLLNGVTDGIVGTDETETIAFVNPAAAHIIGASASSLIGHPFRQVLEKYQLMDSLDESTTVASDERRKIIIHSVPIYFKGKSHGQVMVLQEAEKIQNMAKSLRKTLTQKGLIAKRRFGDIVGCSPAMKKAISTAEKYAKYDSTVLIIGETGTGKEVFAQSIHNGSRRRNQAFVAVNCAALPESLLESELFGYVKGAFTGARSEGKTGLFENANGGTIFLDEITEISVAMQARLLRVLQEREIIRIGDDRVTPVDVRVLASTNRNIPQMIKEGKFREDLYYRLNVLELNLPPLRERHEDIQLLVEQMIVKNNKRLNTRIAGATPDLLDALEKCPWPGNIRQLENVIEQMMVTCEGTILHLPLPPSLQNIPSESTQSSSSFTTIDTSHPSVKSLAQLELEAIQSALNAAGGNKKEAARLLGIDSSTLWRKMKRCSF